MRDIDYTIQLCVLIYFYCLPSMKLCNFQFMSIGKQGKWIGIPYI